MSKIKYTDTVMTVEDGYKFANKQIAEQNARVRAANKPNPLAYLGLGGLMVGFYGLAGYGAYKLTFGRKK